MISVRNCLDIARVTQMSNLQLRCRKCRANLNSDCVDCLVSVHSETLRTNNVELNEKCSQIYNNVFYIKEGCMPKWIIETVNEAGWCKGKLTCPQCSARVGSFDFVSGAKCSCNNFVLPPVHLVKSKVDYSVI